MLVIAYIFLAWENIYLMKAHRAIFTDQLTGTYNQDFFFESAEQVVQLAIRNKVPLSICVIEIDDFALLKEKYGDMVSRRLIKWIADTIVHKCRKSDLLGRLGVKEFGLLMYNTSAINAQVFLDAIRREVEIHGYMLDGKHIKETLSMGISLYSNIDGEALDPVYERAKTALSRAKEKGKNCVITY